MIMNSGAIVTAEFYKSGRRVAERVAGTEQHVLYHAGMWAQTGDADMFRVITPNGIMVLSREQALDQYHQ